MQANREYMKKTLSTLSLCALSALTATLPAEARRGEQSEARIDMESGRVLSLREIEGRVVPRMRGMQYLGPEYDSVAQVYRLKFINKERVIFVDVDGRTGSVLRQR
jgi:hypothetical protein